jgi:hypothetical protein
MFSEGGGTNIVFRPEYRPLGHTGLNSQDGTAGTGQPGKKDIRINSITRKKKQPRQDSQCRPGQDN